MRLCLLLQRRRAACGLRLDQRRQLLDALFQPTDFRAIPHGNPPGLGKALSFGLSSELPHRTGARSIPALVPIRRDLMHLNTWAHNHL